MKRSRLFRRVQNASSAALEQNSPHVTDVGKKNKISPDATKNRLTFENLTRNLAESKSKVPKASKTNKLRATVDLQMMKEELKQLEDPPVTNEEKKASSKKLVYSFFDVPCVDLAQKLLGKILVRRLENGTILKGRIVETEAYIGEMDKASQTYGGKVTPRNIPMYMAPGTIYVYLTYGMYHCFNISSGEPKSCVLIRAVEVTEESDYIELLSNTKSKFGKGEKLMKDNVRPIESQELCNEPWKICTAFAIDVDDLNGKEIWNSNLIWLERDSGLSSLRIVSAPIMNNLRKNSEPEKLLRFYVLGNPCVKNRSPEFEERAVDLL